MCVLCDLDAFVTVFLLGRAPVNMAKFGDPHPEGHLQQENLHMLNFKRRYDFISNELWSQIFYQLVQTSLGGPEINDGMLLVSYFLSTESAVSLRPKKNISINFLKTKYHSLTLDVQDQVISVQLGQYHARWCPGSFRRQVISTHNIEHVEWVDPCPKRGRISTACVMLMWKNKIKCKYMFISPLKKIST